MKTLKITMDNKISIIDVDFKIWNREKYKPYDRASMHC